MIIAAATAFDAVAAAATAVGAVAIGFGPVALLWIKQRATPAPAPVAPPATNPCDGCAALLGIKAEQITQLLRHHLEVHQAVFGERFTGEDGIMQRFALLEAAIANIHDLAKELVDDVRQRAAEERAEERLARRHQGTNPGRES